MNTGPVKPLIEVNKVLVCTDDSPASLGAFRAGVTLGRDTGCRVYILEVVELMPYFDYSQPDLLSIPSQFNQEIYKMREAAVRKRLEDWRTQAAGQGVELEPRMRIGASVFGEIMEEIQELQPDLIIMGRRGRTGLNRLLMGSVTARVIGHSPVNVLVVPKDAALEYKKILLASDGSSYSRQAWVEALQLTQSKESILLAVSVAQGDWTLGLAEEHLEILKQEAAQQGVEIQTLAFQGRPEVGILEAAWNLQANLIVLGSHGRTGLMRLLLGSVAERVIGQASCAVLVVKEASDQ